MSRSVADVRTKLGGVPLKFLSGGNDVDVQLRSPIAALLQVKLTDSVTYGGWYFLLPKRGTGNNNDNQCLFNLDFSFGANLGYTFQVSSLGRLSFWSGNTNTATRFPVVKIGKLTHIAFTIDGTTLTVYSDFVAVYSTTIVRKDNSDTEAARQLFSENTGASTGKRRVLGWGHGVFGVKSALTASQIEAVANGDTTGLAFYLPLTEGSGTTVTCAVTGGVWTFNGVAPTWVARGPIGRRSVGKQCALFDGGASYATLPASLYPSTTNFNIAMWVKLKTNIADGGAIISWKTATDNDGCVLKYTSAINMMTANVNSAASADASLTEIANKAAWQHVVLTYEVNSAKLYVNGTLITSDTSIEMTACEELLTFGKDAFAASGYGALNVADFVLDNAAPWDIKTIQNVMLYGTVPSGAYHYSFDGHLLDQNGENELNAVSVGYEFDYPPIRTIVG